MVRYGDSGEVTARLREPTRGEEDKMRLWEEERDRCLTALKSSGLLVSAFYSRDRDEVFVKVGVGGAKLMELAEQTRYPLQMREQYHGAYAEYRRDTAGTKDAGWKDRKVLSSLYAQHPPPDAFEDTTTVFRTVDPLRRQGLRWDRDRRAPIQGVRQAVLSSVRATRRQRTGDVECRMLHRWI